MRARELLGAGLLAAAGVAAAQGTPTAPPSESPVARESTAARSARELSIAWLDASGALHAVVLDAGGRPVGTFDPAKPTRLGSLWKLVAYAHWVESNVPAPPLRCTGQQPAEETYCCGPGERIDRGPALARSCGLFFARDRVPWGVTYGAALRALPASIAQAVRQGQLGPTTEVSPRDWLHWLAGWPPALRERAGHDLLGYWVAGAGQRALGPIASQLHVKTFTLERADGTRQAGASGWTANGQPLWFSAAGTSADVVPDRAMQVLSATWAEPAGTEPLGGRVCVRVRLFARYPIAAIEPLAGADPAHAGVLRGGYRVRFVHGTQVEVASRDGELRLAGEPGQLQLAAELPLEDYVARVIDREGSARPNAAAWALAVAARTYVLANGQPSLGCVAIDDSSAAQRVAPRPASAGARAAARATAGLVLTGGYAVAGQHHRDQPGDGVLAWSGAVRQGEAGASWLAILQAAYPRASLATAAEHGVLACEPLPLVQAWLERERPRWGRLLAGQPGYANPGAVQVCRLAGARAHASSGSRRIDVAGYRTLDERLAVAHEYLHLAFERHPRGRDEGFVEAQARRLLGVQP